MTAIQDQLQYRLVTYFEPLFIEIVNESDQHNVPPNSESHFKVTLVTPAFEDMRMVKRHQAVYAEVGTLMGAPIHALALHTFTPHEWEARKVVPDSPNCLGGGR